MQGDLLNPVKLIAVSVTIATLPNSSTCCQSIDHDPKFISKSALAVAVASRATPHPSELTNL